MRAIRLLLIASLLLASNSLPAFGLEVIFQENFDQLQLGPPVDEVSNITQAFTHQPPDDWRIVNSLPGIGNPEVGVTEWEGWSFANKDFWIDVSGDERRSEFTRGKGTVAVADPDEWNDLGFPTNGGPANVIGFYNTLLETPMFDIGAILQKGNRLKYQLDSSWIPQCCDDGEQFAPNLNNKTATVRARFEDGSTTELLQWESAPFIDTLGRPSTNPADTPNPNFKSINTNELLYLDLSSLLDTGHAFFRLEFGLSNAGDDWWWAVDNMEATSLTSVPGDMDLNDIVDEQDIDDFAQAMHNTEAYRADHLDELPAERGSPDSVFDFDDIDWFVGVLNSWGVAASRDTIVAAIQAQAIPEPSTGCLATILFIVGFIRSRNRR